MNIYEYEVHLLHACCVFTIQLLSTYIQYYSYSILIVKRKCKSGKHVPWYLQPSGGLPK